MKDRKYPYIGVNKYNHVDYILFLREGVGIMLKGMREFDSRLGIKMPDHYWNEPVMIVYEGEYNKTEFRI